MGACRFMYQNLITGPELISVSSARPGLVGMPAPVAAGSATAYGLGSHEGAQDQLFMVEIDSVSAGPEVGQASFRWQRAASESWEGAGITTSATPVSLADGVSVKWSAGDGNDFELGDAWSLLATRSFGRASLLDADRDREWQSTGCADESITVDLGQAAQATCLVLGDHNLSASATITLMADDGADWQDPAWSSGPGLNSGHLTVYFDQSFRHWRLRLQDPANPDGYLRASLLYLGDYFEPSRGFSARYTRTTVAGRTTTASDAGKLSGGATGLGENWALAFNGLSQTDLDEFLAMYRAIHDAATGRLTPIFFAPFVGQPAETLYCLPQASLGRTQTHQGAFALELGLEEVVRTNV